MSIFFFSCLSEILEILVGVNYSLRSFDDKQFIAPALDPPAFKYPFTTRSSTPVVRGEEGEALVYRIPRVAFQKKEFKKITNSQNDKRIYNNNVNTQQIFIMNSVQYVHDV